LQGSDWNYNTLCKGYRQFFLNFCKKAFDPSQKPQKIVDYNIFVVVLSPMSFPFFPFQFFILFLEPLVEGPDLIPALRACRCSTHAEFRSCSAGLAVSPTLFRFGNQCQFVGNARKRRLWIASLRTGEIQNAGAFKAARAQYIERIARPGVSVCEPLVTAGT